MTSSHQIYEVTLLYDTASTKLYSTKKLELPKMHLRPASHHHVHKRCERGHQQLYKALDVIRVGGANFCATNCRFHSSVGFVCSGRQGCHIGCLEAKERVGRHVGGHMVLPIMAGVNRAY